MGLGVEERTRILDALTTQLDKIPFRTPNQNEAPLNTDDKIAILKDILERDVALFVQRYGSFLETSLLELFDPLARTNSELDFLLKQERERRTEKNREYQDKITARNRRLAYLERHLDHSDYFSSEQIRLRAPGLWKLFMQPNQDEPEEPFDASTSLIDRVLYDVDLARATAREEAEENALKKDTPPKSSPMQSMIRIKEEQVESSDFEEEFDTDDEEGRTRAHQQRIYRQQTTMKRTKSISIPDIPIPSSPSSSSSITSQREEKDLSGLVEIMRERFLHGLDHDFDYTYIDQDDSLDRQEKEQEAEDAYFNDEEEDIEPEVNDLPYDY